MHLETENKVHIARAEIFYNRKREARKRSRRDQHTESISMDFQKNLPCPNISTNIVYYKRQLSFFSFNIHQLSDNKAIFYVYPETHGRKGANEVTSFLNQYITTILSPEVQHLNIFCDSSGGQNKNYTLFRYLHYIVHEQKRLQSVLVTFPIRGHSYLECDKDMGLIKTKTVTEIPQDWVGVFRSARVKPEPFTVIEVDDGMIRDWSSFLEEFYIKKCPISTRPIRELKVEADHPRLVIHRELYNAAWISTVVRRKRSDRSLVPELEHNEFLYPPRVYNGLLPLSEEKFKDLQELKVFCSREAQTYYTNLPHEPKLKKQGMTKK